MHQKINLKWLSENDMIRFTECPITTDYKLASRQGAIRYAFVGEYNIMY